MSNEHKKTINDIGAWLVGILFITIAICSAIENYDWLILVIGVFVGWVIVAHSPQKAEENRKAPKEIVQRFFSYTLHNMNFDDEDAKILGKIHKNIDNQVQSESFVITNKNTFFNSRKLEIAIYIEIIKEIKCYAQQLKIAPILQQRAEKHLKRLENKEI